MSQNNGMICTFKDVLKQIDDLNNKLNSLSFKTINHESITGEGNIDILAYITANEAYPEDWLNGTTTMSGLITKINDDPNAVPGKIYLSTVSFSDLPANMIFAEVKAEIMTQGQYGKVILFTVTSSNVAPYHWEYTSTWRQTGTWRAFQVVDNKESEAFLLTVLGGDNSANAAMKSYLQGKLKDSPEWFNLWSLMGFEIGFSEDNGRFYVYLTTPLSALNYNDYKIVLESHLYIESDQIVINDVATSVNLTTNYEDLELSSMFSELLESIPIATLLGMIILE